MDVIRKTYVPNICISYTLAVLCTAGLNLINGKCFDGFVIWLLELGAFLIVVGAIDYFISKFNYRHWMYLILTQFIINYVIFLAGAFLLHWITFDLEGFLVFTIIFVLVFAAVYYHSYLLIRQDEEHLNKLIKLKQNEVSNMEFKE